LKTYNVQTRTNLRNRLEVLAVMAYIVLH